jgi:hypothetical protein
VRERELVVAGQLVGCEPADLSDVVGRALRAAGDPCIPGQAENGAALVSRLHPDAHEAERFDVQARLLAELAHEAVEWVLALLEKPSRKVPQPGARVARASAEEELPVPLDQGLDGRSRVRPDDVPAGGAGEMVPAMLALDATARAEPPVVEDAHGATVLPVPRHVPATVHELTRVGLLSGLPGEHLARLAERLEREDVAPGETVVREGERGDRFYVVLSGLMSVTQEDRGERRLLRPGDTFGEVALAMNVPRTASVRALVPVVVASCDRATFDELLRPLFADE